MHRTQTLSEELQTSKNECRRLNQHEKTIVTDARAQEAKVRRAEHRVGVLERQCQELQNKVCICLTSFSKYSLKVFKANVNQFFSIFFYFFSPDDRAAITGRRKRY
jgi:hypothetical protein